jgi:hypothetical protein
MDTEEVRQGQYWGVNGARDNSYMVSSHKFKQGVTRRIVVGKPVSILVFHGTFSPQIFPCMPQKSYPEMMIHSFS